MPNAVQSAVDHRSDPERQLIENEELTQEELFGKIEALLSEDSLASLIFSEWRCGTKGPEIMKALDLTRTEYDRQLGEWIVRSRRTGRKECPMSADTSPSKMDSKTLFDNLAESTEQAAPADLLAEAKAAGQDTERIAAEVKNTLLDAVRTFEQRKLHAARWHIELDRQCVTHDALPCLPLLSRDFGCSPMLRQMTSVSLGLLRNTEI